MEQQQSSGKGRMIEGLCGVMAVLSILGGAWGAYSFSYADTITAIGGLSLGAAERSGRLVGAWLLSGAASAVFWYVLSGVGAILRRMEDAEAAAAAAAAKAKEEEKDAAIVRLAQEAAAKDFAAGR